MKINLTQLISGRTDIIELDFEYALNDCDFSQKYDIIEMTPLHFLGKVYRKDEEYYIDADFASVMIFRCNRCLSSFKKTVRGNLSSSILTNPNLDEEDEDIDLKVEGNILDLSSIIDEAIILAMPMKIICDEECKGLCTTCGEDLNKKICNCSKEKIDPRLAKLKEFFKENEEV